MTPQIKLTPQQIKDIDKQYQYQFDLFTDDLEAQKAKYALTQIDTADKVIFELYAEFQSSRKVGKILGVSHNIVLREVRRIREQIIELINTCDEV